MKYDFCVIGGGIVGLAVAHALLNRRPGASLLLLEKEPELGRHQTGRNSGVIHSGIYYTPGSLKARLCREGAARTKEFCRANGIRFEERGKLIVATRDAEVPRLHALHERAGLNGVKAELLNAEALREREPNVTGLEAIFVPGAAIVSYTEILKKLAVQLEAGGAELRLGLAVDGIRETGTGVEVVAGEERIECERLVACAGLQSDRVAKMAGLSIDHRIVPFRGEYFRIDTKLSDVVHAMIYPVPAPDLPFLGIHLTPMIDGSVSVGPNAVLGMAREEYEKGSINLNDLLETLRFLGFWRAISRNIAPGMVELGNTLFKSRYLAACQRYCPSLKIENLTPMEPGIRAQAIMRDGTMQHDFLMLDTKRMVHVCNAPSPAATSALPIGEIVADRLLSAVTQTR